MLIEKFVMHAKNLAKREFIFDSVASLISITPFIVTLILGGYWASNAK